MATWSDVLGAQKQQPYFKEILHRVQQARAQGHIIFPANAEIFNAFKSTAFADVKVVILGQDPYHGPNQAHGLAFSVQKPTPIPPSLRNIYKELQTDIQGFVPPSHGDLQEWAQQGVFLLNTVLTVQQGKAHSHADWGWEHFTDVVIRQLNEHREHLVFMLWGAHAQKKGAFIDRQRHLVLTSTHPSPLSAHRGFLGCRHFSKANQYLIQQGKTPINWQIH
nr:uracil-DNA glycosylase [Brackiella oedipodis]